MGWFDDHILTTDRVFIIAEAGINHNGDFDLALELIRQAKKAGADCVKFQTFRYSASESRHSTLPGYFESRFGFSSKRDWYDSIEFSAEQFRQLRACCEEEQIAFLSTACDIDGLRVLLEIGADAVKVASCDTNNDYLLKEIGASDLPVILSTGMSTLDEVDHALKVLREAGCRDIALMQCTSQYPTPPDAVNLRVLKTFRNRFGLPVGLSDHTQGIHIPIAAAALGARMIEKHFTISRDLPGVDHPASIEPHELREMVRCIRETETALGDGVKSVHPTEADNVKDMRRSLMAARPLKAGTILRQEDITAKRPGYGMAPSKIGEILGKRLKTDMETEDLFEPSMVE
jgi:N,N'-diacetyllegionaminate synthase